MYNMLFKLDKESLTLLGYSVRFEILILIGILYLIIVSHTVCSCAKVDLTEEFTNFNKWIKGKKKMEGFVGANTNYGESSKFNIDVDKPINTNSWFTQNLVITPGQTPSAGAQAILDRKEQPIPLPPGQMLMFANTPFKPECCPNTYSNSMGCACMTDKQYNYLITRGSNNVPYSEY